MVPIWAEDAASPLVVHIELRDVVADGLLCHLCKPLGVCLPHCLASSDTHVSGKVRSVAGSQAPPDRLFHMSAGQLLPNFQCLYAGDLGAMLRSGQAAHQALGSQTHSSLTANLIASSAQSQQYLANLGMGQVSSIWTSVTAQG